jgi:hypothetical protein
MTTLCDDHTHKAQEAKRDAFSSGWIIQSFIKPKPALSWSAFSDDHTHKAQEAKIRRVLAAHVTENSQTSICHSTACVQAWLWAWF